MPRFSLSRLLEVTAIFAVLLVLTQTEGCGPRYMMIESLSFRADDSRIAVTKLTCRDALTTLKHYKANVARTVSWLDANTGSVGPIIHQDFKPGNCGPAFDLWRLGRTSVLCSPSNDGVAMTAFGGGDVTRNVGSAKPTVVSIRDAARNLAYSQSGRLLAASGHSEVVVLNTLDDTIAMLFQTYGLPFLGASLMAFTNDDACLIVVNTSGIHVWDIATGKQRSRVLQNLEPLIHAVAVVARDELVVCSSDWIRRYDFTGNVVATVDDSGARMCSVSRDGKCLAAYGSGDLRVYDLNSNTAVRSWTLPHTTALALSPSGEKLAVGNGDGRVAMFDTATGSRRWHANPPGRYRWPWWVPVAVLVAWFFVRRRSFWHPEIGHSTPPGTGAGE